MNHPEYYAGKLQEVTNLKDLKKYLSQNDGKVSSYSAQLVNPTLHIVRIILTIAFPHVVLSSIMYVQDAYAVTATETEASESTNINKYAHQYIECQYRKLVGQVYYLSKEA